MKIYDVIILGAGASGLMCASNLSKKKKILLIDTNATLGKKIQISGGGKCNITNASVTLENYEGDKEFLSAVLKSFSRDALLGWLDRNGIEIELRKGRYYFCKKSAMDVVDALKRSLKGVEIVLQNKILSVKKEGDIFLVETEKGFLRTSRVVVATGGESFKNIGASSIGLEIAKSFDIAVKSFRPALVGLTLQKEQFWMKELSGLSCYVHIKVANKTLKEEMLFAHKGISGPAILSASLYWTKGNISIDFLPEKSVLELLCAQKRLISSQLPLPKRLAKALLNAVDVEDKEVKKLTKRDKERLLELHEYSFSPAGNFGFTKAEVSAGGVLTEELEQQSLESKKVKGLYFIGEVVDITGELGGYNFQWAFASGYCCAKHIN